MRFFFSVNCHDIGFCQLNAMTYEVLSANCHVIIPWGFISVNYQDIGVFCQLTAIIYEVSFS